MPTVYLSPSTQEYNLYYGGGTEEAYMNRIVAAMEPALRSSGIEFARNDPEQKVEQAIAASNSGEYALHLAIHSNAAPKPLAGKLQGTDVYMHPLDARGNRAAALIVEQFEKIYPDAEKVKTMPTETLREITETKAPSVLVEVAYHDNKEDAAWIKSHVEEIAEALVRAVCEYFDLPYCTPCFPGQAIADSPRGRVNILYRPQAGAAVLGSLPTGGTVHILGECPGWYTVQFGGRTGYIRQRYVQVKTDEGQGSTEKP